MRAALLLAGLPAAGCRLADRNGDGVIIAFGTNDVMLGCTPDGQHRRAVAASSALLRRRWP